MRASFSIEESLVDSACQVGNHPSREAAIEAALREYVERRRQRQIIEMFGTVEFDSTYNFKEARCRGAFH
jgi:metal-responsive CopG/Arc/MetJ family transcriptional regulator